MSERIVWELTRFSKSLQSLEEAIDASKKKVNKENFEFFRDSVIQRFEYTIEQAWKLLKHVLLEEEWLDCNSPKGTIKEGFQNGYITNIDIWFAMIEARNMTSHTYEEENADALYQNIITYKSSLEEYDEFLSAKFLR